MADGICHCCLVNLPELKFACQKCREPLTARSGESLLCPRCQKGKRYFQDCVISLTYAPPVSDMLQRLKYSGRLIYLKPLTRHLVRELEQHYIEKPWPEAMIPVPMHWWKMRKRGFNQADLIARQLSCTFDIPVLHRHVRKHRSSSPQSGLRADKRQSNVRHTYILHKPVTFKHVAVVDDVMTTGATVEELCRLLIKNGVQTIDIWCIARTPTTHNR